MNQRNNIYFQNSFFSRKLMKPCFCGKMSVCRHLVKCFCSSKKETKPHKHDLVLRKHQIGAKKSIEKEISKESKFISESMILLTKSPSNHDLTLKLMEPCFCGKLIVCRHWVKCLCGSHEGTKSHKHDLVLRKHQFGAKKSVERKI